MKNLKQILLVLGLMMGTTYAEKGLTHGANLNYQETTGIKIQAVYDDGKPIANGQVTVYNPVEPATPWLTGTTDDQGQFSFIPDYRITGNWQVKVRQAGHGAMITLPIQEKLSNEGVTLPLNTNDQVKSGSVNNAPYTWKQKLVMAAFGVWGCMGTALYFSKKKA